MIYYSFNTKAGLFRLLPSNQGWQCWFGDDYFDGPYKTAQGAAEDIAGGHTAWPSCGDPSRLGVPDTLEGWTQERLVR